MNLTKVQTLAQEFALYMTKRLSETNTPLIEGLTSMAIAVENILETTAETLTSKTGRELAEIFKSMMDAYFEETEK